MEQTFSPMFKGRPLRRGTGGIGCHPLSIGNTLELIQSTHETRSDWKLHENSQWRCQNWVMLDKMLGWGDVLSQFGV